MIVQACINGARPAAFHPALPLTAEAMARDATACVAAGAAELHLHPRAPDGQESLSASVMDQTMLAMRRACPGTLIGVSTGGWIEGDQSRTLASIAAWGELPDYASVNLSEPAAPAIMATLHQRGIGVEAGLASVADAERFIQLQNTVQAFRILIEISQQDTDEAMTVADAVFSTLHRAGIRRPLLLHGEDVTVWPLVARAADRRCSTRVGLEDGATLPDGLTASGNAELVSAAVRMMRLYNN